MKALIYQYWDGNEKQGNLTGVELMKDYAEAIGVDHVYEHDTKYKTGLGQYSSSYGMFKPILEENDYDYIMYADCDVVPRENCKDNIFEEFKTANAEIGICEEINAPAARKKYSIGGGINNANDEKWVDLMERKFKVQLPRTKDGLPKVYNSGMVLWSKAGMEKAREKLYSFEKYVNLCTVFKLPSFYTCDQPYLHAMLEVCNFKWTTMPYKWNSSVHYDPGNKQPPRPVIDMRGNDCKFVHIQLNGADNFDADKIKRIVNNPVKDWNL